jgi:nucleoside-diphosphate-sugar epimerase
VDGTTVLITGGAGRIGLMLRSRLARPGRVLRLLDTAGQEPPAPGEQVELVTGSITDPGLVRQAATGVDAVVHLAGHSGEAPWPDIADVNITGTQLVLEAARAAGVPRVVLASSNHAVGFRGRDEAGPGGLPADVPPAPDTYYGVGKVAMEALAALYHARFGMDVPCLRIGTCDRTPGSTRGLATWLSPGDCARLVEACLAAPSPGFRTVWGISRNTRRWWSLTAGEELGYHPEDDSEVYAAELAAAEGEPDPADPVHRLVGGPFCTMPLGGAS